MNNITIADPVHFSVSPGTGSSSPMEGAFTRDQSRFTRVPQEAG